ncbi:MAG: threonine/serine exporter ThrE family protein [Leucobacter sp.]
MNLRQTRLHRALSTLKTDDPQTPETPSGKDDEVTVLAMLGSLGPALLAASQATNEVDDTLRSLAQIYGRPELKIVTLPTFVLVDDPVGPGAHASVFPTDGSTLSLTQAGEIEHLIHRAAKDRLAPSTVLDEVAGIIAEKPRFGFWVSLFGHVLLTVGFGLVLNPTYTALPFYVVLGVLIGLIVLLGSRARTLSLVLPVLAAFLATGVVGLVADTLVHDNVLRLVAPALASLLPGLTLTIAAVELTNGQVIAGASRLGYGFARLGLLAFGVYVGLVATGASLDGRSSDERLGSWAPWVGILFVSLGYYLYSVAPKRSLPWILFALAVAYSAQLVGHTLIGAELSGMIGALVAVPVIYLVSHLAAAPPPAVMLTCAYWMLVPGAMGFIGLSEAASGSAGATNTLLQTVGSIIAIAIGMVIGTGISRDTGAFARALHRKNPPRSTGAISTRSPESAGGQTPKD